jgi:hypothetical protein
MGGYFRQASTAELAFAISDPVAEVKASPSTQLMGSGLFFFEIHLFLSKFSVFFGFPI